jgi:putative peptidoglycan lipid II flippase
MAWGVFASGILQLLLLICGLKKQGFPLSIRMPKITPPVKRLLILAFPTAIAGGITQVNLLVGQIIASAQSGAIAVMNYAERLMQLPLGIIGISIGVVLLPELTRALAAKDAQEANTLQNRSLEFGLGLTIPAAVGLFMLNLPLVALVYERGAFDRETAEITSLVLAGFAVGLPSFVLIKIFQPSFYAREDMRTPMWFSGANAIINIILSLVLFPIYGVLGLAIATSIAGWINAFLLWAALHLGNHFKIASRTWLNLGLIVMASLAMAGVLYAGDLWMDNSLTDSGLLIRLILIGLLIAISSIVYFGIVIVSGAIPANQLKRMLKR